MAKRLMCIVLSLLMIMAVLPTGVIAEADVGEEVSTNEGISLAETDYVATITDTGKQYETLAAAISDAGVGETVQLSSDITLSSAVTIASGADIVLDLNGYTLARSSSDNSLAVSGKLTLEDSSSDGSGKITTGGGTASAAVYVKTSGAEFIMNSGTISSSTTAVYVVSGATFTLNAGTITGNASGSTNYYSLYIRGTFIMNGGSITANKGRVYIYGSGNSSRATFEMNGGTITENSVQTKNVGVYLQNAYFTMNGGSITNNSNTSKAGGGVYIATNSTFYMNAGTISGNTATYGAGVYMGAGNNCEFYMYGGTITENSASYNSSYGGGGVYVTSGATFTMTGGAIYGNTSDDTGDDIYIVKGENATLIVADSMTAEGKSFTGYKWYTDASGSRYSESNANEYTVTSGTAIGTTSAVALKAAKPTEEVIPTLYGRSLTLGTQIGINYYFDFTDSSLDASDCYATFTVGGTEYTDHYTFEEKTLTSGTYYVVSCSVYFYQMAEGVSVNIYKTSDDSLVATYYGGSIRSYYDSVSSKSNADSATVELLEALLNYGGYGQAYLIAQGQISDSTLANYGLDTSDVTSVTADDLTSYEYTHTDNASYYVSEASVTISSTQSAQINFKVTGSGDYTVAINDVDKGSNLTEVSSDEILVQSWDTPVKLTISVGDEVVYTMNFSVLSYVKDNLTSSDENLVNLVKAMYNYNQAANAYLIAKAQ